MHRILSFLSSLGKRFAGKLTRGLKHTLSEYPSSLQDAFFKPSIPPLCFCALALWFSCAAVYSLARALSLRICIYIFLGAGIATFLIAILIWKKQFFGEKYVSERQALGNVASPKRILFVAAIYSLVGVVLGIFCGGAGAATLHTQTATLSEIGYQQWRFDVVEDSVEGIYGKHCVARATNDQGVSFLVRVEFGKDEKSLIYGDVFQARASLQPPRESIASYCWQNGIAATARFTSLKAVVQHEPQRSFLGALRYQIISFLEKQGSDTAIILQALLCGFRGKLHAVYAYNDFKLVGLAHLLAVSGAHLVIVGSFVALMMRFLRVPRLCAVLLQGAFLCISVLFTGVSVSALRAAVMAGIGMSSFLAHRRPAPLNALAFCIMGFLAFTPCKATSISFALSAGSTLGIILFSKLFSLWLNAIPFLKKRFIREALSLSFAANSVTLPLSAALFSQVSLIFPLANILALPFFTLICTSGFLSIIVLLAFPSFGALLFQGVLVVTDVFVRLIHALTCLPMVACPVAASPVFMIGVTLIALMLLWTFWPQPSRRAGVFIASFFLLVVFLFLVSPSFAPDRIVMLNVGQGDAFLICSQRRSILIDTGNRAGMLREGLARQGVRFLDAIIVTHSDSDHCGALASLYGVVGVGEIYLADDALICPCEACGDLRRDAEMLVGSGKVRGIGAGDLLNCGNFELRALWPYEFVDEGGNADSLCFAAYWCAKNSGERVWSTLFCGDIEGEQLKKIIEDEALEHVDILKVGHHGARVALDENIVAKLSPSCALISVGEDNRYGHPADETLDFLDKRGVEILRSDTQGEVTCVFTAERIALSHAM